MKYLKKTLCALTAFVMLGSMLTGCTADSENVAEEGNSVAVEVQTVPVDGNDNSETESAETAKSEESQAGNFKKDEKDSKSEESHKPAADGIFEDYDGAKEVLQKLLDAVLAADVDTVLALSNYGEMLRLQRNEVTDDDALYAELKEALSGLQKSDAKVSFTIGDGKPDPENLKKFNEVLENGLDEVMEMLADADDDTDEEKALKAEQRKILQMLMQPLDGVYNFDVTFIEQSDADDDDEDDEDDEDVEHIAVLHAGGRWFVDMGLIDMLEFSAKTKDAAANTAAKSLFNAVMTALVDMDEQSIDVSVLDGKMLLKGSDFENLQKTAMPQTDAEIKTYFLWKVAEYLDTITTFDEIAVAVEKCCCTGAAVKYKERFGVYPPLDKDTDEPSDIEEALAISMKTLKGW